PGLGQNEISLTHFFALTPIPPCNSRFAACNGDSPGSNRPAGSSQSSRCAGRRNCLTSKTRSFSSTAIITAEPGCRTIMRWISNPEGSVATSSTTRKSLFLSTSFEEITFISLSYRCHPRGQSNLGTHQSIPAAARSLADHVATLAISHVFALALRGRRHPKTSAAAPHSRHLGWRRVDWIDSVLSLGFASAAATSPAVAVAFSGNKRSHLRSRPRRRARCLVLHPRSRTSRRSSGRPHRLSTAIPLGAHARPPHRLTR